VNHFRRNIIMTSSSDTNNTSGQGNGGSTMTTSNIDLKLGMNDEEDHPRRLVEIGANGEVLAYGGEDGTISLLELANNMNESSGSSTKARVMEVKIAHQFDDSVRALACSKDGKRVVVGFDDGSTQVFAYNTYDNSTDSSINNGNHHPFVVKTSSDNFLDEFSGNDGLGTQEGLNTDMFSGPRFSGPIRDLAFDPRNYCVAFATEAAPGFCVVDVSSESTLDSRYLDKIAGDSHDQSGVRGVSYAPDGEFIASLGMDGRLCIFSTPSSLDPEIDWDLHHRDPFLCVSKKDVGELNGADAMDRSSFPAWSPNSKLLALPGATDLQLRFTPNLDKPPLASSDSSDDAHCDDIAAIAFSPNSKHMVTSARDLKVCVWSIDYDQCTAKLKRVLPYQSHETHFSTFPTSFLWTQHQHIQILHVATANGTLFTVYGEDNILTERNTTSSNPDSIQTQEASISIHQSNDESQSIRLKKKVNYDDDDNDDETLVTVDKDMPITSFIDDEADDDDEDQATVVPDLASDEIDGAQKEEQQLPSSVKAVHFEDQMPQRHSSYTTIPKIQPQAPFVPSSTPISTRHFLCHNHIGQISTRNEQDNISGQDLKYIDISFVDSMQRRRVTFADNNNFILGSLGDDGAILVTNIIGDQYDNDSDMDDDVDNDHLDGLNMSEHTKSIVRRSTKKKSNHHQTNFNGSVLYFYRFETFGLAKDKDWYITLPDAEKAVTCASGKGWSAVATNNRYLRMYTNGGVQSSVLWLKGDPVTMTGRGRFLAVVYHEQCPLQDKTQQLGCMLIDVISDQTLSIGSLSALSIGCSLSWIGFSEEFSLFAMDTKGILSMLGIHAGGAPAWSWSPMLDCNKLKKSKKDEFWPISVLKAQLVCALVKGEGGQDYPDPSRMLITTTLGLRIPLATSVFPKSANLEEVVLRATIAEQQRKFMDNIKIEEGGDEDQILDENDKINTNLDKVILKSCFIAIEAGKVELALDLVSRLRLEKSFDIALQASERKNRRTLSDRIDTLRNKRFFMQNYNHGDDDDQLSGECLSNEFDDTLTVPESINISPEIDVKKNGKHRLDDNYRSTSSSQGIRSKKLKALMKEEEPNPSGFNPFAKKKMESPAKSMVNEAKEITPSQPPSLARSSTFSLKSRQDRIVMKHII